MHIKIMGPGCPNCRKVEELVKEVVDEMGVEAVVEKVSDFQEMAKAGVFSTPAVAIDGNTKCVGTIPSKDEIRSWLN